MGIAISSEVDNNATNYINTLKLLALQKMHKDVLYLSCKMNQEDTVLMSNLLGTRYAELNDHPGYNTHPIAANLQGIAYQRCLIQARKFNNNAIDIGGSVFRTPKEHHLCTKISNTREDSRYINAINSRLNPKLANITTVNRNVECIHGAEKCGYKAKYGYMINVYDIDMPTIATIMDKHDIVILDVWMFLPYMLLDNNNGTDQKYYTCKNGPEKGKLYFSLNDQSNIYVHDQRTWKKYYTTTTISGKSTNSGAINVEHIESFGTFTNIRFTKTVVNLPDAIRCIPFSSYMKDYVMMPRIVKYLSDKSWIKTRQNSTQQQFGIKPLFRQTAINGNIYEQFYVVEAQYLRKVREYANSLTKTAFTYETILAYSNAQKNNIFYEQASHLVMVHRGMNSSINSYLPMVMDIFILAAIDRLHRTQEISSAMHDIQTYNDLMSTITRLIPSILSFFRSRDECEAFAETQQFKDTIHSLRPITYVDQYFQDVEYVQHINRPFSYIEALPAREAVKAILDNHNNTDDNNKINSEELKAEAKHIRHKCKGRNIKVPGDGFCGAHTLHHFAVTDHSILGNEKIKAGWYDNKDMIAICKANNVSLLIHYEGEIIERHNHYGRHCISINYTGVESVGHWQPFVCECRINDVSESNTTIGRYSNLQPHSDGMYISDTNDHLTDTGGQPKDFATMFPNYADKIKKPVYITTIDKYVDTYHYCLAVANNYGHNKDIHKTADDLRIICEQIDEYARANQLTVYMPIIGTGAAKNPVCCVKKQISRMMAPIVYCFFRAKDMKEYIDAKCTHAGYEVLATTHKSINVQRVVNTDWGKLFNSKPLPVHCKLDDIVKHTNTSGAVFEISMAPGHFARHYQGKYDGAYYTKGLDMYDDVKPLFTYNNPEQFSEITAAMRNSNYETVVSDIPPTANDYNIMNELGFVCAEQWHAKYFVYKMFSDDPTQSHNTFGGWRTDIIRSGASATKSSEMFAIVFIGEKSEDTIVNTSELISKVDKLNAIKSIRNCTCKIKFDSNGTAKAKVTKEKINNLIQLLSNDKSLSSELIDKLKTLDVQDTQVTVKGDVGVGGAGKTMGIVKSTCINCTILISPYRNATDDINHNTGNKYASTYVAALDRLSKQPCNIVIDEMFVHNFTMIAIYKLLSPKSEFFGTGDHKQIKAIDWDGTLTTCKWIQDNDKPYKTVTKRNPKSVIDLFKKYIPGINTTSKVDAEVIILPEKEIYNIKDDSIGATIIAFTHDMVDYLKKNVTTIKEHRTAAQTHGRTIPNVHLYMADLKKIPAADRVAQFYTAASRCSRQLILYGKAEDLEIIATTSGSTLERALLTNNVDALQGPVMVAEKISTEIKGNDQIRIKTTNAGIGSIVDTLTNIYHQINDLDGVADVKVGYLPTIETGESFKSPMDSVLPSTVIIEGKRIQSKAFNRLYAGPDQMKATQTLLGRYASKVRDTALGHDYTHKFYKGLTKWFKPNWEKIANTMQPDSTTIWKYCVEALKSLQSKFPKQYREMFSAEEEELFDITEAEFKLYGNFHHQKQQNSDEEIIQTDTRKIRRIKIISDFINMVMDPTSDANKYKDLETEFANELNYHTKVDFHMKTQPKNIMKDGFDTKNKFGQGISAWTKIANMVNAAYIRHFDAMLPFLIKPNVQLSYGKSDNDISAFWLNYSEAINNPAVIKFLNDFGQFDSTQEKRGITAITMMYRICHVSEFTIQFMLRMRSKWCMTMRVKSKVYTASAMLEGKWQQHSGQIHTLGSNTLYSMGALGACFDFGEFIAAGFKGDDSFVLCHSYKAYKEMGTPLYKKAGFDFKIETPLIAEYIANIVTPFGFVPDLLRRCSRVVSKIYKTTDDWEEIRLSTADALVVTNESNLNIALGWLQKYYTDKGINVTISQLEDIWFYLKNVVYDPSLAPKDLEKLLFIDTNDF